MTDPTITLYFQPRFEELKRVLYFDLFYAIFSSYLIINVPEQTCLKLVLQLPRLYFLFYRWFLVKILLHC